MSKIEKTFQPIEEPLKSISEQLLTSSSPPPPPAPTTEEEEKPKTLEPSPLMATPPRFLTRHTVAETPDPAPSPAPISHLLSTPLGRRESEELLNDLPLGILAKEYVRRLIVDRNKSVDTMYGPHYERKELMIGDGKVNIDGNDLYIHRTRNKGTQDLYELIFINEPDEGLYNESNLAAYKSIMIATNAHRQGYSPEGRLHPNRGVKYVPLSGNCSVNMAEEVRPLPST